MTTYSIDDAHGTALTQGIRTIDEARRIAQHHADAGITCYLYAVGHAAAIDEAMSVDWGSVDDAYPADEAEAKREAYEADEASWNKLIGEALAEIEAGHIDDAQQTLVRAGRIERQWGDDPATRKVREILSDALLREEFEAEN